MKKILKKALCGVLAIAATVSSLGVFTSCTTDNPEVEIKISFDDETYTLNYKLYRKLAPSTVKHFLALAENNYYDGLCVHDFDKGDKMYTGGYDFVAGGDDGGLVYKNYYDVVKTYKEFPHTVWTDESKSDPTYTLYGEFSDNGRVIESGALKQSFGALTMFYTEKNTEERVAILRGDGNGVSYKDYKYNSATSLFSISLASEEKTSKAYCTFATLENADELKDLLAAIEEYSDFVSAYSVEINSDDRYVGDHGVEVSYNVPTEAIIIKSVKVTKY
ncbi:MAG: peptidylprolyl isomerase [Clostridia bacterium]|nr:peptidylprolyl isomerase [Clostridia bacterium]